MGEQTQLTVEQSGKWIYRVGGFSAIILGLGYLLTIPVVTLWAGGFPPPGTEARLAFFAEHAVGWWATTALMIFTDLLYIPLFLALYHALKDINQYLMLLAFTCEGLFVVLDLAVTWTSFSSLIIMGGNYVTAINDAQRALVVGAAGYSSAMIDSPLSGIYAIVVPALGLFFAGLVMHNGIFHKAPAYLAMLAGICGILAGIGEMFISDMETTQYINATLSMIWFFLVGFRLYKFSR